MAALYFQTQKAHPFYLLRVLILIIFSNSLQAQKAELILYNGTVITMEENFQPVEAIAISQGKILDYGSQNVVLKYKGTSTRMLDLQGRTVIPGIVDPHNHIYTDARQILDSTVTLEDRQDLLLATGITSIGEPSTESWNLPLIQEFALSGKMKTKTNVYMIRNHACNWDVEFDYTDYPLTTDKNALFRIAGIKIFADGGSCGTVAATTFTYPGGGMGDLFLDDDQLTGWIQEANAKEYPIVIHAQGDRAIAQAQKSLSTVIKDQNNPLRHRIDHNSFLNPSILGQYNEIGIPAVCFAHFPTCLATQTTYLQDIYGAENLPNLEDWRALTDANPDITIAWHSDAPLLEYRLPQIMYSFVTKKDIDESGNVCNPPPWLAAHAITIKEVLSMMTINAAYVLDRDDQIGSLKPGKSADLVILSENPLSIPSDDLIDIEVLMTMIEGEPVYCHPDQEDLCHQILTNSELPSFPTFSLDHPFPNPSITDQAFIDLSLDEPKEVVYDIYDVRGKLLYHSSKIFCPQGNQKLTIHLPSSNEPLFIFKFHIGSEIRFRKLQKF